MLDTRLQKGIEPNKVTFTGFTMYRNNKQLTNRITADYNAVQMLEYGFIIIWPFKLTKSTETTGRLKSKDKI